MNILIIGSGGREHAISWKLAQEENVEKIFVAPGNPGIAEIKKVEILAEQNFEKLAKFAKENSVDFCFVGPEVPLCDGITNVFQKHDIKIFGPDKKAAQLEASKDFAKEFMFKYNIPTANSKTFTDLASATKYLQEQSAPIVIKADGLAAGKGVTVAQSIEEAQKALEDCFDGVFGDAGQTVVIEDFLDGQEASIFAFVDGKNIVPLLACQDHKPAYDGDKGPNTGGMGTYCPAPIINDTMMKKVKNELLDKFLDGINKENLNYRGILFAGLMIKNNDFKVLEFNVRFGDPETQSLMMKMKSSLSEAMLKTCEQDLDKYQFQWHDGSAVCVIMASGGYPNKYEKGFEITGIENAENKDCTVFHAGTKTNEQNQLVNAGGRVLAVCSHANSLKSAVNKTYQGVKKIHWKDAFYRNDIAQKAL